jgi:hypothetical protein
MGALRNRRRTNVVSVAVIAIVGLCGAAYGIDSFLQTVHAIGS